MGADKFRALILAFILMGAFVGPLFGHVSIIPASILAGGSSMVGQNIFKQSNREV